MDKIIKKHTIPEYLKPFSHNGKIIYLNFENFKFYDEDALELPLNESCDFNILLRQYYSSIRYDSEKILDFARRLNRSEKYTDCEIVCNNALKDFDHDHSFIYSLLPTITSCYRSLKMPEKAIQISAPYIKWYMSEALATSLSATYLDLDNIEMAILYFNKARTFSKDEISPELNNLYKRFQSLKIEVKN